MKCACNRTTAASCRPNCNTEYNVAQPTKRVQALINVVLDGCCKLDEITKEVVVPKRSGATNCNLLGKSLVIKQNGPISCKEIQRDTSSCDCQCQSTLLCSYPLKFEDPFSDDCACDWIEQTFTSLGTVSLNCTDESVLDYRNSRIVGLSAVITQVEKDYVVVTVAIAVRLCLRQTVYQEHCINVSPVITNVCKDIAADLGDCSFCSGTDLTPFTPVRIPY